MCVREIKRVSEGEKRIPYEYLFKRRREPGMCVCHRREVNTFNVFYLFFRKLSDACAYGAGIQVTMIIYRLQK